MAYLVHVAVDTYLKNTNQMPYYCCGLVILMVPVAVFLCIHLVL